MLCPGEGQGPGFLTLRLVPWAPAFAGAQDGGLRL